MLVGRHHPVSHLQQQGAVVDRREPPGGMVVTAGGGEEGCSWARLGFCWRRHLH